MIAYRYTAINQLGQSRRGIMPARNEQELASRLQAQGMELLMARQSPSWSVLATTVSQQQRIEFCLQLEQLLRAGVPLLQALEALAMQSEHAGLQMSLQTLIADVEAGKLLSQAMQAQPTVFHGMFCHLVAAGEHTGRLSDVFRHLATTLQWQADLQAQLWRGLMYPLLLAVMVCLAAGVMLTFLVPQMAGFLNSLGQTLPWSTRTLLALSRLVSEHGFWISGLLVLLTLGLIVTIRTLPAAGLWWDSTLLRLPVMGQLLHQWSLARFCRFLGLMYETGIPLMQALQLCQGLLHHRVMAAGLQASIERVQAGSSLADSFAASGWFPPLMIRMLRVGETTGHLDDSLSQLSEFYDRRVQAQLHTMLRLLEPVLTVLLGAMLLMLMAAVMLPVYDSFSQLRY